MKQLLLVLPTLLAVAYGQTVLRAQVLSTFIFTRHGDQTPFILPQRPSLTPLGAQQLFRAGSNFRQRYITSGYNPENDEDTTIRNISPIELVEDDVTVLSTDDQFVSASAQAFMQGLYPPLAMNSAYPEVTSESLLANGTNVIAPLQGIQYPNIQTLSSNDLSSIWLAGSEHCPAHATANSEFFNSPYYQALLESTREFYDSLQPDFLNGVFSDASVGFFDAYYIWDYLNYAYIHNTTVAERMTIEDLTKAKVLADNLVFAINANTTSVSNSSAIDNISVIGGRTLAARILSAFSRNMNSQGRLDKMTLFFGSHEPMVAFAALADLISPQNGAFYGTPAHSSSFIFELFALRENDIGTYPDTQDLYVRFLYQNASDEYSSLVAYPLFGRSPSQIMMTLSDFIAGIQRIQIFNVESWCETCGSYSVFCPAFETNGSLNPSRRSSGRGLQPAIAGVIGAVVTLVIIGLILAMLMLLAGCRFHRVHKKRRSELGGFKGAEKLASDQDLTIPKGTAGATVITPEPVAYRGHERVGSWELRDQAKAEEAHASGMGAYIFPKRRPSFEDDEHINSYTTPVKPHDHV